MATGALYVSPEELKSVAEKTAADTARYKANYEKIYTAVESLNSTWQGEANRAFVTQIEGFKNDFESMKRLLDNYSEFLRVTANNYQNAENINIENARVEITGGR